MEQNTLIKKITDILEVARYAPSVHNTQPWLAKVDNDRLIVSIDPKHQLTDGDPTGRQTYISLGIFTEAILVGAGSVGLEVTALELHEKTLSLTFNESRIPVNHVEAVNLLKKRSSDRSIYSPVNIDETLLKEIQNTGSFEDIHVHTITDKQQINTVANLTSKGIRLALSNPGFRRELSRYLVIPGTGKKRGISVKSLYIPTFLEVLQPTFMRLGIGLDKEARVEKQRFQSASAVIILTGAGDMPHYWLDAGRTYLRVSLSIEKAGLSQATSAAIVEASNYHEDIEHMLGTTQRILAVIRIGKGSDKRFYSPRVDIQDLITSN